MSALDFGDYLSISFENGDSTPSAYKKKEEVHNIPTTRNLPFAASPVYYCTVIKKKRLTQGEDVKAIYDIGFDVQDCNHKFEPGDTIGIIPCNDESEVDQILAQLDLISVATKQYNLCILKETSKKKPIIPGHIPPTGTIRELLIKHVDIRSPPKKIFLRSIARYASKQEEAEKLQFLCSPKGSQEYHALITTKRSLLSLLKEFPSCQLPIERLLENLPPLQPRPYSIASSPLLKTSPKEMHITFATVCTDWGTKGICSGWLENTIEKLPVESIEATIKNLSISSQSLWSVPLYFRKINNFRLPSDSSIPVIMIGPGTGVAPFIGFLQHRWLQSKEQGTEFGTSWLFYGCRYSDRDFLYKPEIEEFLESKTLTKLFSCFSRENSSKIYVQDLIKNNGKDFINKIVDENASIYICGDAKGMAKDVRKTVVWCLEKFQEMSNTDAEAFVTNLERTGRYIQDIWI